VDALPFADQVRRSSNATEGDRAATDAAGNPGPVRHVPGLRIL